MAQVSTIDEAILNKSSLSGLAQQRLAARELRRVKAGEGRDEGSEAEAEQPQSLRQRLTMARRAMDVKQKAKEKIEERIMAPVRMGTNYALRWAWLTLIPSFGLTLIYINMHVFLRWVVGEKLFCKLGDEWIPKQIQAFGGEAGKMGGRTIGIVEVMGLLFLDLLALFVIIGILAILVWIADSIFLKVLISGAEIWDWIWNK